MKTPAITLATLGLTLGALHAQTVPLFFNYQGNITSGSGAPLGSTGAAPNYSAAPINRKLLFRIYDDQSAGTLLWSEQQTATISIGEFSVLLGQGTAGVYNGTTEPRPAIDTVFTSGGSVSPAGPLRYLEIVVDDGNGTFTTADVPIAPRQQITTTGYSFRARMADTVAPAGIATAALADGAVTSAKIVDNSITSLKISDGSVTTAKIPDSAITSLKIVDGAVDAADLANNSVNSAKITDGAITGADIANSTITQAKLDPSIGSWTANGANVFRTAGNVGIGTSTPSEALDLNGNMKIAGANVLEFGGGVAGRATNSGKIGYQSFTPGALDIVGAGTGDGSNWRIKMWATGGTEFTGGISAAGGISTAGGLTAGSISTGGSLYVGGAPLQTMTDNGYSSNAFTNNGANTYFASGFIGGPAQGIEAYGMNGSSALNGGWSLQAPVGIRAEGWIASARGFVAYSDRRIKRDIQASPTAKDLAAIRQLQVTDYRMVDHSNGGMAWRKGFIAQEVEKVIPGAVTRSVEFVPDIFSLAKDVAYDSAAKTLSLVLVKDHDLKTGERVRLHIDGKRQDLTVSAVPSAREFVVEKCESAPEKVLVYGRQVDDFRTVDYDRIFTTSVGAIQDLARQVDAIKAENADLRTMLAASERRFAELEATDKAREERLVTIENLLITAGKSPARTASVKVGK